MPRVLVVDPLSPDESAIREAVRVLRAGGLVALPTETVYGLGARALDERALERVFAAKGRPLHHPLIAHVADATQAAQLAAHWPKRASDLAHAFWPGPLTIVVRRRPDLPAAISGGGDSIALRVPSHLVALAVIAGLREAVAAPSANRYQGLSPTTAQHVVKELGDRVDLVLDAGPCDAGIESTVVDARQAPLRVLRPGAIRLSALRAVVADTEDNAESIAEGAPRVSPGLDARHYAPRARLVVADTRADAQRIAHGIASEGGRVAIVTHEQPPAIATPDTVLLQPMPADPAAYARALYSTLHRLDDSGLNAIVVVRVPDDDAWRAVSDRLRRASS
jgi:L-threonylcarbamoyladenylate synthase